MLLFSHISSINSVTGNAESSVSSISLPQSAAKPENKARGKKVYSAYTCGKQSSHHSSKALQLASTTEVQAQGCPCGSPWKGERKMAFSLKPAHLVQVFLK